jgi:hypothetical protein
MVTGKERTTGVKVPAPSHEGSRRVQRRGNQQHRTSASPTRPSPGRSRPGCERPDQHTKERPAERDGGSDHRDRSRSHRSHRGPPQVPRCHDPARGDCQKNPHDRAPMASRGDIRVVLRPRSVLGPVAASATQRGYLSRGDRGQNSRSLGSASLPAVQPCLDTPRLRRTGGVSGRS